MTQRKFCPVYRVRKGSGDEQGFWFQGDGSLEAVFLTIDGAAGHYSYPDIATMRRQGWIDHTPVAA